MNLTKAHTTMAPLLPSSHPSINAAHSSLDKSKYTLGIIEEFDDNHLPYIAACEDYGVSYKTLNISAFDWIQVVQDSECDAFLVWPSFKVSIWKRMFDERLKIMTDEMHKIIYPTYDEVWLNESKLRMSYWLKAHNIPHTKTWVFYSHEQALEFVKNTDLPLVVKHDMGSRSAGVKILHDRDELLQYVNHRFGKGLICPGADSRDSEWGYALFQEFLPEVVEWRLIRIGESYFGHQKLTDGVFHSGSGKVGWHGPPQALLEFIRELTDNAGYTAINVDIFETPTGHFFVNEIQSHFAAYIESQMYIDGKPGRYLYDYSIGEWRFEEGIFCRNSCCDLRVKTLLDQLDQTLTHDQAKEDSNLSL